MSNAPRCASSDRPAPGRRPLLDADRYPRRLTRAPCSASTKLERADIDRLEEDGLRGNALTLRALAQWRLGLYDKARATADEGRRTAGRQIHPRDAALLAALPGLIKNDQAYQKILPVPAEREARQRPLRRRHADRSSDPRRAGHRGRVRNRRSARRLRRGDGHPRRHWSPHIQATSNHARGRQPPGADPALLRGAGGGARGRADEVSRPPSRDVTLERDRTLHGLLEEAAEDR